MLESVGAAQNHHPLSKCSRGALWNPARPTDFASRAKAPDAQFIHTLLLYSDNFQTVIVPTNDVACDKGNDPSLHDKCQKKPFWYFMTGVYLRSTCFWYVARSHILCHLKAWQVWETMRARYHVHMIRLRLYINDKPITFLYELSGSLTINISWTSNSVHKTMYIQRPLSALAIY